MQKILLAVVVLSSCGVCGAVEPAVPVPPETSVTGSSPAVPRPALPTSARQVAEPAGAAEQSNQPAAAVDRPQTTPWFGPAPAWYGYSGYRPEAVIPATNDGLHLRYPYYSYRRPWYPAGPASVNVTIIW
jgi:hypothetical protein